MKRILNTTIRDFDAFYQVLVEFVLMDKLCYSVQDKKEYKSWMKGTSICMSGEDRQEPSLYSKEDLKHVFEIIRNSSYVNTKMLDPAVGRHRSPILALMVASGVVVRKQNSI